MSKLEKSNPPSRASRIGLAAAECAARHASEFRELRALARVLQMAARVNAHATSDQRALAELIVRRADECEAHARIDWQMFLVAISRKRKRTVARRFRERIREFAPNESVSLSTAKAQ
jgi:hypothetical protein